MVNPSCHVPFSYAEAKTTATVQTCQWNRNHMSGRVGSCPMRLLKGFYCFTFFLPAYKFWFRVIFDSITYILPTCNCNYLLLLLLLLLNRNCADGIANTSQAGWSRVRIPARGFTSPKSPDRLWGPHSLLFNDSSFPRSKTAEAWGWSFTGDEKEAILLFLEVFMACTGTIYILLLLLLLLHSISTLYIVCFRWDW
jgi:hypothetical protein